MHRNILLNLLHEYEPTVAEEVIDKEKMIAFIEQNPLCFERSLLTGHVTASAWLLSQDKSQVLLTHHAKLGLWLQLGGHCDGNNDVLSVALKEAQEESGIQSIIPLSKKIFDISIHGIPATAHAPEHYHYDVRFLFQLTSNEQAVISHESLDLQWFSQDQTCFPTNRPETIRMLHKWRALTTPLL